MNIYEFAAILNGRQMGKEITREEERQAKELGFVVVYGYSDDNAEFAGAISEEVSCFNGATIYLNRAGIFEGCHHDEHCKYMNMVKAQCKIIEAVWCGKDDAYAWTYKTDIPHATFDILEEEDPFCQGIVFDIKDL